MKTTKKIISIMLAVTMMMSCISVCFGTISFAADDMNAVDEFIKATDCDAMREMVITGPTSSTSGSGSNAVITNTSAVSVSSYEYFLDIVNVLRTLDAAIQGLDEYNDKKTHNSGGNCNASRNGCTDFTLIKAALENALKNGGLTDSEKTARNVDDLLNCVLTMSGAKAFSTSTNNTQCAQRFHNVINVTTTDIIGYLGSVGTVDKVEQNIALGYKYTVSMSRQNYTTKGGFLNLTTYNHYHHAVNTGNNAFSLAVSSTDTQTYATVNAYVTYLMNMYNTYHAADDGFDKLLALAGQSADDGTDRNQLEVLLDSFKQERATITSKVGGEDNFDKLYADYIDEYDTFIADCESALSFADMMPVVNGWIEFENTAHPDYGVFNWGGFDEETIRADYDYFKTNYYDVLTENSTVYNYFINKNQITEEYFVNFRDNVVAFDLEDTKQSADSLYNTYKDTYETLTTAQQQIVYSELTGYINSFASYSAQVINAIFPDGYDYLLTLQEELECEINNNVLYFAENANKDFSDLKTDEVIAKIAEAKNNLVGLNELKSSLEYADAALLDESFNNADKLISDLYQLLADRFTTEVEHADEIYTELNRPSTLDITSFSKINAALSNIEDNIISYLQQQGQGDLISDETIAVYEALKAQIYPAYESFLIDRGFNNYKKTEINDIVRPETTDDVAREGDYIVTDENVQNVIDIIEAALADENIKALLGFDIAETLTGLIDGIYSNDVINAIIQYVYPLVAKEFAKVWADLPDTVTVPDVDTGFLGLKADVVADLDLYDVEDAVASVGINTFPRTLGAYIEKNYPAYADIASVLQSVTMPAAYNKDTDVFNDPWQSALLYTTDEDGNKKLNLDWGVTDRESFVDAAVAALSGLEPLLLALVSNIAYTSPNESSDYNGSKIGTGAGTASVGISLSLTIDPISLIFRCSANDGYDNAIAPIFEALGLENIPHGEELTDTRKIIEDGLFDLVDQLLEKVAAAPLDTVLSILPNLAYALEGDMITPLLKMLKTDITYQADAKYSVSGIVSGNMEAAMKSDEPIAINIGDMLNLEDLGLDISSFSAVWSMITGMLGKDIPAPEVGEIASMGELIWKDTNRSEKTYTAGSDGKAAYIVANKADVLISLVRYILNPQVIGAFIDLENAADIVNEIITNITKSAGSKDLTVAAVVELLNQVRYDLKEFDWYNGTNYEGGTVEGTPALEIYLDPQNDWTKEKATYLYNNIEVILNSILSMAGTELDIDAELSNLINSLFTNKNITALAKLLGKISLDESISSLINSLVGVDLSAFAAYENIADDAQWGFDDGDGKGFASALSNLLSPVEPVLDFILKGSDIKITLNNAENGSSKTITLLGYDGYNSAVIPLLEALGCDVKALDENENVLKAVLDSLIDRIDKLTSNSPDNDKDGVIYGIIELLPGVLYYLASNGLSTSIRNLLQPIYVILDTIRPVYDVDINELLKGLDIGVEIDIDYLDAGFAVELISSLTGLNLSALEPVIYDACKILGSEYESKSTLQSQWKKGAYSARFDEADMLTVIVSFLLEWVGVKENAETLDSLLGTDGIVEALGKVFESVEIKYTTPDWMYFFDTAEEFERAYKYGLEITSTLASLTYPNNWTDESAQYIADNLGELGDMLAGLIDGNYTSLSALLKDKVKIYSTENVQAIADLIANLLKDIDSNLLDAAGRLLGVDIVGLSQYKAPEGIDTAEEFTAALTDILTTYLGRLVEWLLLGEDYTFFKKSDNTDSITINGAEGYAEGLALVLEAVGCENLPSAEGDTKAIVSAVFTSLFNRVDEIFENPAEEIVDLIPNLIYFLNADGATAAVDNVLSAVYALLDKLEALGVKLDISELLGFNIRDLSFNAIIDLVENLAGLDLTAAREILIGFCVGKIKMYDSVSVNPAFMMTDFDRKDVITIAASIALLVIDDEDNAKAFNELLGDDIYKAVLNILNMEEVPVQEMSWLFTEYADTDKVLSAMESSELYKGFTYGPLYTEEMAQYIADNIGTFIDNIIYLLGIQIDGRNVDDLKDLLNGLVNGSLYNSETAASIRDLIAGLVKNITQINGGEHIAAIVRTSLGVDLNAWDEMEFGEFENDRAKFTQALCDIVKPLYPVLNWLLSDEDFTFFVDKDNNDIITILGAEGYAYGIIPVLEVLGCENILTPAEYYAAAENDENVTFTAILNPLFDRLDEIMANPAEEILAMLPAVVYFINSNGLDTVVKNTLNAVYTLLNAIEPIAKVDLYEIIGVRLDELDFNTIFDVLIDMVAEKTGYEFDSITADYIAELTMGKVVSYTSANGKKAYTMEYQSEKASADMVTIVLRLLVTFITNEKNQQAFIGLLQDNMNMSDDAAKYVKGVLETIEYYAVDTHHGMDGALATLYYVYFGIDTGADHAADGLKDLNAKWQSILNKLGKSDDPNELTIGNMLAKILDYTLEDIFDSDGLAPNGLIAFFQKIIEFFRKIIEWFKKLF
ncbi:MAG: hypothetical protein ACI4VI_01235 [Acutalibacteraceae bacterium]